MKKKGKNKNKCNKITNLVDVVCEKKVLCFGVWFCKIPLNDK